MARSQQPAEDIVFEDLHGVNDDADVTLEVNLDSTEGDGITKHARVQEDSGTKTGDDEVFDNLTNRTGKTRTGEGEDGDTGKSGSDDGSDDRNSNQFKARLNRERRVTRREREAREATEAENARLRKQLKKAKGNKGDDDKAAMDRQITTTEADLTKAIEDGKTTDQVRLTSELTTLKAKRIAADYVNDDDDDDDPDDVGTRSSAPKVSDEEQDWREDHGDWFDQPGFEKQTRIARRISNQIYSEGYETDDPEYFAELTKRLQSRIPDVFDDDGSDAANADNRRENNRQRGQEKGRSPVAAADDGSRDRSGRKNPNRVELDASDLANMRRFGLNPDDPKHLKEYATNKRQVAEENS